MTSIAIVLIGGSTLLVLYALIGYPALLMLGGRRGRRPVQELHAWPMVSITVPAYNEEATIAVAVEALLAIDYPADRLQILVVSDGSTDATDRIVADYAGRGVELLRVDTRRGKSAAENQARSHLRGEIIINTDASVRVDPAAVKHLVRHFADPEVGLASGRDVSIARSSEENRGEAGYVGYEMWIRSLETRTGGIVGASGCLYAIRREFHDVDVPEHLSRDFMSALTTRERGSRAVSVPGAICYVPRTASFKGEYRRKVRTILRGIQTLIYKGHLLDPRRHGAFAWKLWSHKVCRWAIPWAGMVGLVGVALLVPTTSWAALPLVALGVGLALTAVAWGWPEGRAVPELFSIPAYLLSGAFAVCMGTVRALNGFDASMWEPTRRSAESPEPTSALEHD
jgi:cellulose synthase/poly-beta-1,6-N-acetylglucosamine synthase-like glycosyltransferase